MPERFASDDPGAASTVDRSSAETGGSSAIEYGSRLLLAVAGGAITYLVLERLRSATSIPDAPTELLADASERAESTVPVDLERVPVVGQRVDRPEPSTDDGTGEDTDRLLRERATPDVDEKPAEPGSMTVGEDVVDDVLEEE